MAETIAPPARPDPLHHECEWAAGCADGKRIGRFDQRAWSAADQPSAGAVFAGPGAVSSEFHGDAHEYLELDSRFRAVVNFAARDDRAPFERGGNDESESRTQAMEIWRRRDDDVGL
jgi:hypothetical protein